MLIGAAAWLFWPAATTEKDTPLIPDLAAKADSITEIDLLAGQTTSVLQKQGDRFVLAAQGNLPVPIDHVRQLLNDLAQVQLLEPKTSDPKRYDRLGVGAIMNDPQGPRNTPAHRAGAGAGRCDRRPRGAAAQPAGWRPLRPPRRPRPSHGWRRGMSTCRRAARCGPAGRFSRSRTSAS